jgi:hypothetical protein
MGSYFDQMHPSVFWAMDSGIALAGGILILLFRKHLQRALAVDDALEREHVS